MKKFGIRKVKTWKGLKWGVVDLATKGLYKKVKKPSGKEQQVVLFKPSHIDVVEYKNGQDLQVGLFSYDKEGFRRAKELQEALNS